MTAHLARTRYFPMAYSQEEPPVWVCDDWAGGRPLPGGELIVDTPVLGVAGQPYMGMDPSAPTTWVRPYNPQPGMIARLNFDGAKLQGDTPTGGVFRNPMHDRADVRKPGRVKRRWR